MLIPFTEFLAIGKNKAVPKQKGNLSEIVSSLIPLIEANAYGQDKYLEVETNPVPDLFLNSREIRQMLLNLCANGLEAMPAGGTIRVRTYVEDDQVVLEVQDEGEGIKPEVLEKIGTPFYTTKPNGTGLGLGICNSIATRHNAQIDIKTNSKGTTFYVRFNKDGKQK